jgi:hypothetical protein
LPTQNSCQSRKMLDGLAKDVMMFLFCSNLFFFIARASSGNGKSRHKSAKLRRVRPICDELLFRGSAPAR